MGIKQFYPLVSTGLRNAIDSQYGKNASSQPFLRHRFVRNTYRRELQKSPTIVANLRQRPAAQYRNGNGAILASSRTKTSKGASGNCFAEKVFVKVVATNLASESAFFWISSNCLLISEILRGYFIFSLVKIFPFVSQYLPMKIEPKNKLVIQLYTCHKYTLTSIE